MKASRDGDVVYLTGHCRVEDAETLLALLQPSEGVIVDISGCDSLHAAVVQVLLAFGAPVVGAPIEPSCGIAFCRRSLGQPTKSGL